MTLIVLVFATWMVVAFARSFVQVVRVRCEAEPAYRPRHRPGTYRNDAGERASNGTKVVLEAPTLHTAADAARGEVLVSLWGIPHRTFTDADGHPFHARVDDFPTVLNLPPCLSRQLLDLGGVTRATIWFAGADVTSYELETVAGRRLVRHTL